jgi:hypothetical protein
MIYRVGDGTVLTGVEGESVGLAMVGLSGVDVMFMILCSLFFDSSSSFLWKNFARFTASRSLLLFSPLKIRQLFTAFSQCCCSFT